MDDSATSRLKAEMAVSARLGPEGAVRAGVEVLRTGASAS